MSDDIQPNRDTGRCDNCDRVHSVLYDGFGEALLTNRIMLWAYAISLVILSLGLVILLLGLAYLSFMHPDKFNSWLLVIGGPAAMLIIGHLPGLIRRTVNGDKPKS